MTSRVHSFVALVLIAAVVSLAFSPLLTQAGVASGHHPRTSFALTAALTIVRPVSAFFSASSTTREAHTTRSQNLIELNCVRLC
jgi:hypothetical protein